MWLLRERLSDFREKWFANSPRVNQILHRVDNLTVYWDSATCITYSTDYYQRLTLESWFTNLEKTPLNRSQQLTAPYKRLIDEIKQN